MFGVNPVDQFAAMIDLILQQKQSFYVFVVNNKTVLIIVDSNGTIMFIDSHIHGHNGALIARSDPYQGQQAKAFSSWFTDRMLIQSYGFGMSICSLSTISYL